MQNRFKPEYFFYLTIFCLPLYLVRFNLLSIPTNVLELLASLAILIAFLNHPRQLYVCFKTLPNWLILTVCGLLSGTLLSVLANANYRASLGILKGWFLVPILFAVVGHTLQTSKRDFYAKIFLAYYLSALSVSLMSLGYKLAGLVTYDNRLSAFYLSPNHLGMYLAPALIIGLAYFLQNCLAKKYRCASINLGVILIFALTLFYTFSYGTWLALVGSLIIPSFLDLRSKLRFWFLTAALIFSCLLFISQLASPKLQGLLQHDSRSSLASRQMIWRASWLMLKSNPLVGIGPGNFQTTYLSLQPHFYPYLEWAVPQPHNLYLAFWLQTGIIGLLSFLILLFLVIKRLLRQLHAHKNAVVATALLPYFVYILLHGLIDTPYWKNDLAFLFWLFVFASLKFSSYLKPE